MSDSSLPRRVRVERNIYRRPDGTFEVGFRDGAGVQRWRTIAGGIQAARRTRDEALAQRGRGQRVTANPRLRFGEAAASWLGGPVSDLRGGTRYGYRNALDRHLLPRFSKVRLDVITPDDFARLVRELRADRKSEATIAVVLGVASRIYKYASRRLGWAGPNPVGLLLTSERPRVSTGQRRPIFTDEELRGTIAAATGQFRILFAVAAVTGARVSELLGLRWEDVHVADIEDADIEISHQVNRKGRRGPTKTDGSARTVPIPPALARLLVGHKLASGWSAADDYVFATRTGRPLGQRNVGRALRAAQVKAVDDAGRPLFPMLHVRDSDGRAVAPPRGAIPSMHCFRHTVASRALLAGESIDELAFQLGHRDATVTRAVYLREVTDGRRRAAQRTRMVEQYDGLLRAAATREP